MVSEGFENSKLCVAMRMCTVVAMAVKYVVAQDRILQTSA